MSSEEKILKGAEELFFKYGVRSVTMDDIAKNLGMSKKTIYQYYKEKDEIVYKLMQSHMEKNREQFQAIAESSTNIVEETFGLMKEMAQLLSKTNPLLLYELQRYYPQTWKLIKDFKESCVQSMLERSMLEAQKQGLVREDVNVRMMALLRMEETEMPFNPAIFPADKFSIVDVQLALTEHFLYGICTLKGHKLINKYKEVIEEE